MAPVLHRRARGAHPAYPKRSTVSDKLTPWRVVHARYAPTVFCHPSLLATASKPKPAWADDVVVPLKALQSRITWSRGRRSLTLKAARLLVDGTPRNPVGRTGMVGRGLLGKWGPNHAADPIVTRYDPARPTQLQVVTIKRRDTGEDALPGGMVDAGQTVPSTLRDEFKQEALRTLEGNPGLSAELEARIDRLFDKGRPVYQGYVDDPRNTDNAWMETQAVHFHISPGDPMADMPLAGGDDAVSATWTDVTAGMRLYASHAAWVDAVKVSMERRAGMRARA